MPGLCSPSFLCSKGVDMCLGCVNHRHLLPTESGPRGGKKQGHTDSFWVEGGHSGSETYFPKSSGSHGFLVAAPTSHIGGANHSACAQSWEGASPALCQNADPPSLTLALLKCS